MNICALYTQDPEIGSLVIFVISVLLCYYCDCDFTAFGTGGWSCSEDIVRHSLSYCNSCEVAGVPSIEWLINRAVRARKVGQQQEAVGPQGSGGM